MRRIWKILGAAGAVVLVFNLVGINPLGWLPSPFFDDDDPPIAADTTLLSIARTQDLRSATGEFSVPVQFGGEQNGWIKEALPDALDANSGIILYQGTVDALVDLSGLTDDDLKVDPETNSVTITVPEPTLTRPNIDPDKSQIVSQNRGLLTRLGEVFSESPMQGREKLDRMASDELTKAAVASNLQETARDNAEQFLVSLGEQLGFDSVTVTFVAPAEQ